MKITLKLMNINNFIQCYSLVDTALASLHRADESSGAHVSEVRAASIFWVEYSS
jgi:hypothetical protein